MRRTTFSMLHRGCSAILAVGCLWLCATAVSAQDGAKVAIVLDNRLAGALDHQVLEEHARAGGAIGELRFQYGECWSAGQVISELQQLDTDLAGFVYLGDCGRQVFADVGGGWPGTQPLVAWVFGTPTSVPQGMVAVEFPVAATAALIAPWASKPAWILGGCDMPLQVPGPDASPIGACVRGGANWWVDAAIASLDILANRLEQNPSNQVATSFGDLDIGSGRARIPTETVLMVDHPDVAEDLRSVTDPDQLVSWLNQMCPSCTGTGKVCGTSKCPDACKGSCDSSFCCTVNGMPPPEADP